MALDQSVLSELLDAFRTGEGLDLIKEAAALVCQELIEAEPSAQIGEHRYERSSSQSNERNGHRPRVLSTKAGDVELAIPKLPKASIFPSILEPRRRIDQALCRGHGGLRPRGVHPGRRRAGPALGVRSGISRSEVSRICAGLDEVVDSFRERRLDHVGFPYVYLDATYLHVREHHQVTSKAVVIATGVAATGHREILGIDVGDSEDETFWREFLRKLRSPGLEGVQLVIPTSTPPWSRPIKRCFQGTSHQRCRPPRAAQQGAEVAGCRVVGTFPNEASVIRLGGAVLLDVHDEWVSAERRYFSEGSMAKLYRVVDTDDAPVKELKSSD
jgi:putative transposase